MPGLDGRRIAITGAARGIGLATARVLHARGATVLLGDLDADATAAAARTVGPRATGLPLDVTDHDAFARFLDLAQEDGPLDVLVNNAGIMPIGAFTEQPHEAYRRAVEVNVMGVVNGMHLALPDMVARGRGHVVNVASTAGKGPVPGGVVYCGTKAAVIAMTETARVELARTGVDLTCVIPHFTRTELISGTTPTRFLPVVEPTDVAEAIADAVRRPTADVYVPRVLRPLMESGPLLGRRVRDLLGHGLGAYRTFLDVDRGARAGYDARAGYQAGDREAS